MSEETVKDCPACGGKADVEKRNPSHFAANRTMVLCLHCRTQVDVSGKDAPGCFRYATLWRLERNIAVRYWNKAVDDWLGAKKARALEKSKVFEVYQQALVDVHKNYLSTDGTVALEIWDTLQSTLDAYILTVVKQSKDED